MPNEVISISDALNHRSKELYNLTVQHGQACLLNDKDKASYYWQTIIEGYTELDKLIITVRRIELKEQETADILAEIGEGE